MMKLPDFESIDNLDSAREMLRFLASMFESLQGSMENLTVSMMELKEENAQLRRLVFGQKSERIEPVERALAKQKPRTEEEEQAFQEKAKQKRQANRAKKTALPLEEIHYSLPEESVPCDFCQQHPSTPLGEGEVSFSYEYFPPRLVRIKHIREKKVCGCGLGIQVAPPPLRVGDSSHHGPGFHAHVVTSKCLDSLPLERQAKRFNREGVPCSPSTLGDLFHRSARELKPLHQRLLELVKDGREVNADETPIQVQDKKKTRRAFMWTFIADGIVSYVYSPSRSGETPLTFLQNTSGTLQVDGYSGYNAVCTPEGRERAGCWAHARRKFFDALPSSPEKAQKAMDFILELYRVEYLAAEKNILGTQDHLLMRKLESQRLLNGLKAWLLEEKKSSPPRSPLGKAINYTQKQWKALTVFVKNVSIPLDNNMSERALRTVALGRKNYLFVGNDKAGENLAVLQSLCATCVAHDVKPQAYLTDVLLRVSQHPASQLDDLLPMNWKAPE